MHRKNFSRYDNQENHNTANRSDRNDRNASRDLERSSKYPYSGRPGGLHASFYEQNSRSNLAKNSQDYNKERPQYGQDSNYR